MLNVDRLRGIIAERNMSQSKVAKELGIAEKTFYRKMKQGVFGLDEAEAMIRILNIEDPASVFFAEKVTYKDTSEHQ